jgi:hypothetical protein
MDFSLNDGDTLFTNYQNPNLVVDSVRPYTLLDGTVSKIFYLQYATTYIEGIGPYHGLTNPLYGWSVSGPSDATNCVKKNNQDLYNSGWYPCAGIVDLKEVKSATISISFSNDTHLLSVLSALEHLKVSVYDATGRPCLLQDISSGENKFSLAFLNSGCYLIKVFNEKEQETKVISVTR